MKKIIRGICLISLCVLLTGCFGKKAAANEEKVNKTVIENKNVTKEQEVDGVKISDIQLSVSDGLSTYTAKVTNESKKEINIEDIDIIVKDDKDKELVKMIGYIGETIKPDETKEIISTTDMDLSKANLITYKVNKK